MPQRPVGSEGKYVDRILARDEMGDQLPDNRWVESLVGPRVVLEAVLEREILCPNQESNTGLKARNVVTVN
jgi:hypothetical protein